LLPSSLNTFGLLVTITPGRLFGLCYSSYETIFGLTISGLGVAIGLVASSVRISRPVNLEGFILF
jgi:hypothetical protein